MDDSALLAEFRRLAKVEHGLQAELLRCLAEIDVRRIFAPQGFSSMFSFLVDGFGWAEGTSCKRVRAARLVRQFPVALQFLEAGNLTVESLSILAPHLTGDNHQALLKRATGQTCRQVERLIASLAPPVPPPADIIRRVPTPNPEKPEPQTRPIAAPATPVSPTFTVVPGTTESGHPVTKAPQPEPSHSSKHLAENLLRLSFTAPESLRQKMLRAEDLMKLGPNAQPAKIFERALDEFLARHDPLQREPAARLPRPTTKASPTQSRYIPQDIKLLVWARDEGQCTFLSPDGRRCAERRGLEVHHIKAFALGGSSTDITNLCLTCKVHHALRTEECFGREFVAQKIALAGTR